MKLVTDTKSDKKIIGEVFHMDQRPEQLCVNFFTDLPDKVVTIYYDNTISIQKKENFSWHRFKGSKEGFVKNIYSGDKITLEF